MYVSLRAAVRGELRTATFEGREHIVVPVVALVEGVIHAANSATPELVLAEEFAKVPDGWNGRPVTWDHPNLNGQQVSANEPVVLEKMGIGTIFHALVEDRKLKVEAWIDTTKTPQTERALQSIERIKKGETVEISVGAFVQAEKASGEFEGKTYKAIWREIVPDHLAFLPEGTTGACSVEMGCGAPRAAEEKKMTLKKRFAELMEKFRPSQEDTSDTDLRNALWAALNAVEPGFLGIDAVFPEATQVVFAVAPEETVMLFRQSYSLADDGSVDLKGEKEEVRQVTRYETASADAGGEGTINPPAESKEDVDMEKKDRVIAIIASGKTCFTAADEAHMLGFDDERLTSLEAHITAANTPVVEPVTEPVEVTPEEEQTAFLAKHPDIATIVADHKATAASKHTSLVAALVTAQKTYTEDELNKMDVKQLEKLSTLAGEKKDFSGQTPRAASNEDAAPPPIDMAERVRKLRSA